MQNIIRVFYKEEYKVDFKEYVSILKRKTEYKKNVMFVCIGTSDILWDSVGPLVGTYLKNKIGNKIVIGDMDKNICNYKDLIKHSMKLKNKFIVAIDVALSNELQNDIYITNNPISMGKAFNKSKGEIGDLAIKAGISNWSDITFSDVKYIAKFIADGILLQNLNFC